MKKITVFLCLLSALLLPVTVQAREISFTTVLDTYSGNAAYLAFYLTNAEGKYQRTLWVAGKKSKYYRHLPDWARGSGLRPSEYDGLTGASVRSGKTQTFSVDLDEALLDAGLQIRIDSAVEDQREYRAELIVPLTTAGAGKPVAGKSLAGEGYVKSFSYQW